MVSQPSLPNLFPNQTFFWCFLHQGSLCPNCHPQVGMQTWNLGVFLDTLLSCITVPYQIYPKSYLFNFLNTSQTYPLPNFPSLPTKAKLPSSLVQTDAVTLGLPYLLWLPPVDSPQRSQQDFFKIYIWLCLYLQSTPTPPAVNTPFEWIHITLPVTIKVPHMASLIVTFGYSSVTQALSQFLSSCHETFARTILCVLAPPPLNCY